MLRANAKTSYSGSRRSLACVCHEPSLRVVLSLRNTTVRTPGMNVLCLSRRVSQTRHDWFLWVYAPAQAKDLQLPEKKERMR